MASTNKETPTTRVALVHIFLKQLQDLTEDNTMPTQQILLLTALYVRGQMNQGDLTKETGVAMSSCSRNIAKLGKGTFGTPGMGYVTQEEDERDRRIKLVRLTPKGKALIEEILERVSRAFGDKVHAVRTSPV